MSGFTIGEITIPTDLATDAGRDFIAMVDVRNACEVEAYGIQEVAVTAADMLPHYRDPHEINRVLGARIDGEVVGRAIHMHLVAEPATAWITVQVLPGFRGRGIGRALADAAETIARELGQTRLISYVPSADATGERLAAATGIGSVPAGNREVRFALARGWTLEQVERGSRVALPADLDLLEALEEEARPHAADYRVLTWAGATPAERLGDLALLQTRMSTDAPSGDLGQPEDIWTGQRVADFEYRTLEAQQLLTAAALHEPSGRLVGFTRLGVPPELGRAVGQWDTIVLREHRGHRLGMLLKAANLRFLAQVAPGHPSVLTWNAEENRHMLQVNEAVGFVPIGVEGAWGRTL